MSRWVLTMTLALGCVGGLAAAQDGRIDTVSSGIVTFTVSADDLAAAAGCPGCTYVFPDPGPAIVFQVRRQNPNDLYTVDALRVGWNPASALQIQARYTVTTISGATVFLVTPWLTVGETPTLVFTQAAAQRENRVHVRAEYRLALSGNEAAGEFVTRVTHRIRENGDAVSHDVRVSLPTTLTLRLVGATAATTSFTIAFDYGDDVAGYVAAVTSGAPLAVTATDLVRAEINTNHPRGYTVTVTVDEVLVSGGGADLRGRLQLLGAPADGRTFTGTEPTEGFVPLFGGSDYELTVAGDEAPGAHLFTVRLEAVRNP